MTQHAPAPDLKPVLAEYLCFAVYSANLAFGKAYRPILDGLGLTYTQYIALICLAETGGQTVSDLGRKLFLESNTLTPILKNLESSGYVTRHRDPKDERRVIVSLTEAGEQARRQASCSTLAEQTGLDGEAFGNLLREVSRLRDNLVESMRKD